MTEFNWWSGRDIKENPTMREQRFVALLEEFLHSVSFLSNEELENVSGLIEEHLKQEKERRKLNITD